jgi:NADH-quinone oxidoreductase subunit H
MDFLEILWRTLAAIAMIGVVMTLAGYSVLAERKVSSWIQGRVGPNRTRIPILSDIPLIGPTLTRWGIFQLPADGLKFLFKEDPIPGHVNKVYYVLAPVVALIPALTVMCVMPFGMYVPDDGIPRPLILANLDIGILFILALNSLGVYGIVMAGWAANSKYPFFGSIRSTAQMISYELAMGISILPVFLWASNPITGADLSLFGAVLSQAALWNVFWMPLPAFVFLVSVFAETNRLPFDMPESETELVGGFHTEYGAFKFGLFFTGEYAHMFLGSAVFVLLFLGGWQFLPTFGVFPQWLANPWLGWHPILAGMVSTLWFIFKTLFFVFVFMWVRWTLPRFRYDQVMNMGWKWLVPLSLVSLFFYIGLITLIDAGYLQFID